MTIDEARAWLQRHADNTPMPGAREEFNLFGGTFTPAFWIPIPKPPEVE